MHLLPPLLLASAATCAHASQSNHSGYGSHGYQGSNNSVESSGEPNSVGSVSPHVTIPGFGRRVTNYSASSPSFNYRAPFMNTCPTCSSHHLDNAPTVLLMDQVDPDSILYNVNYSNTISVSEHTGFVEKWTAFLNALCPPEMRTPYPEQGLSKGTLVTSPPVLQNLCPSCTEMGMAWRTVSLLPPMTDAEKRRWPKERHRNLIFLVELANDLSGKPFAREWTQTMERMDEQTSNTSSSRAQEEEEKRPLRGVSKIFNSNPPFLRELMASSLLNHELLPTLICHGTFYGHQQLVYKYVDGMKSTLYLYNYAYERCLSPNFTEDMGVALVSAISYTLSALFHLHSLGLVHGDIKEDNIIIDKRGRPHIIDLDLTRMVSLVAPYGTRGYICPEMKGWVKGTVGKSADFWSFGIVVIQWSLAISAGIMDRKENEENLQKLKVNPPKSMQDLKAQEQAIYSSKTNFEKVKKWFPVVPHEETGEPIFNEGPLPFEIGWEVRKMVWPLLVLNPADRNFETVEAQEWFWKQCEMLRKIDYEALDKQLTGIASPASLQLKRLAEVPLIIGGFRAKKAESEQSNDNRRPANTTGNQPPNTTGNQPLNTTSTATTATKNQQQQQPQPTNRSTELEKKSVACLHRHSGKEDGSLHTMGAYAATHYNSRLRVLGAHLDMPPTVEIPIGAPERVPISTTSYPLDYPTQDEWLECQNNAAIDTALLTVQANNRKSRSGSNTGATTTTTTTTSNNNNNNNAPEGAVFAMDMPKHQ